MVCPFCSYDSSSDLQSFCAESGDRPQRSSRISGSKIRAMERSTESGTLSGKESELGFITIPRSSPRCGINNSVSPLKSQV